MSHISTLANAKCEVLDERVRSKQVFSVQVTLVRESLHNLGFCTPRIVAGVGVHSDVLPMVMMCLLPLRRLGVPMIAERWQLRICLVQL